MRNRTLLLGVVLLGALFSTVGEAQRQTIDTQAAFARLKTLAGEWEGSSADMGKVRLTFEVVAGGTAILERETGEKMPTMLTMYHLDGNRLLLTHYCMAGNQPRMQAKSFNDKTGELAFDFVDATNLVNPAAGHMHAVKIQFVDANTLTSAWQFYENNQPKFSESARYTRIR